MDPHYNVDIQNKKKINKKKKEKKRKRGRSVGSISVGSICVGSNEFGTIETLSNLKMKKTKSLSEKYDKLKSKNEQQKKRIADLETKILILEQTCDEYENEMAIKQIKNKNLEKKIDRMKQNERSLMKKIENLVNERNKNIKKNDYLQWNYHQIIEWICSLQNGKYDKYESRLFVTMKDENITGRSLIDLDKNDLHRYGITAFSDKINILKHIKDLNKNDIEGGNVDSTILIK